MLFGVAARRLIVQRGLDMSAYSSFVLNDGSHPLTIHTSLCAVRRTML